MKSKLAKGQQPPAKLQDTETASAAKTVTKRALPPDMEEEDEYDEELLEQDLLPPESSSNVQTIFKSIAPTTTTTFTSTKTSGMEMISGEVEEDFKKSLAALQKKYSVPNYEGFEEDWKPYRSDFIEKFYEDFVRFTIIDRFRDFEKFKLNGTYMNLI